ncbi:hypothetical protein [Streptomyces mirabilis]|uniref:hypothetical protein n=1 Tax=Streptomyces mirabilis TaxID=68239 RepID=UPI0034338216
MSHHFDYPEDETLDISDAYCFAGAGDRHGPRTVFGMNTSPTYGKPWNPAGYYELKIDTNSDYVEDITYRATFPIGSDGTQYVQVEQLTGAAATDREASGTIITPPNAPVGEVVECRHGIKLFAGQRRDPFYNFIPFPVATTKALATGTFPDFDALRPAHDDFANTSVRSFVLEVPVEVTGHGRVHFWATTAYFDKGHSTWVQLQRAAEPNMTTFFDFANGSAHVDYNASVPTGTTSWAGPPTPRPIPPRESGVRCGTTSRRSSRPAGRTGNVPTASRPHGLTARGRRTRCSRTSSRSHLEPSPTGTRGATFITARA